MRSVGSTECWSLLQSFVSTACEDLASDRTFVRSFFIHKQVMRNEVVVALEYGILKF